MEIPKSDKMVLHRKTYHDYPEKKCENLYIIPEKLRNILVEVLSLTGGKPLC